MIALLQSASEEAPNYFFLNGLLLVITPLLAMGLPLLFLRRIPKQERGPWVRGMLTVGLPAIVVCIIVASLLSPAWEERNYVRDAYRGATLNRETVSLTAILLRSTVLCLGTALLIWAGGFINARLAPVEE